MRTKSYIRLTNWNQWSVHLIHQEIRVNNEELMPIEIDYLRAMLTPEMHCEDCPFEG